MTNLSNDAREPFVLGRARRVRSTEKAICVTSLDETFLGERWVPKSAVHENSEIYGEGDYGEGELVLERWFARRQGWIVQ